MAYDTDFLPRLEDLARRGQQTGVAHSKFLTAAEAATAKTAFATRRDIVFCLDGGFADAERQIAVFTQPDWGMYERDETLAALVLRHRRQDEIRHRDVLGAVLGLGLSRDVLGDIVLAEGEAFLVCLAHTAGFITQELSQVGRVGVQVGAVPLAGLPTAAPPTAQRQASVASLRLDAVVAAAFRLSRSDAGVEIEAGRVQLAHRECQDKTKAVQVGDILSLRGRGRVVLQAIEGLSRKGRQRILLGFYKG